METKNGGDDIFWVKINRHNIMLIATLNTCMLVYHFGMIIPPFRSNNKAKKIRMISRKYGGEKQSVLKLSDTI